MASVIFFLGAAMVGFKLLWSFYHPGLLFCCLFWFAAISFNIEVRQWWVTPGLLSNAIATIVNGGFMPSSHAVPHIDAGIYIDLTPDSNLPYLCDYFDGISVGDFLILAGMGVSFGLLLWNRRTKRTLKPLEPRS